MRLNISYRLFLWSFVVMITSVASCSKTTEKKIPDDVFSRDSMVMIMAKIHIAEALLHQYGSQTSQIDFKAAYLQKLIHDNSIDTARFNRSFNFYASQPDIFTGVYEDVINEISRQQAEGKGK